MGLEGRRVLFVSYNGMLEPLGQTQVIAYLRELAKRGIKFTLLSFEKPEAFTADGKKRSNDLRCELATQNIDWHWLRYHQTPSLPATLFDVYAGIRYASRLVREHKIEMVHARGHIPATIALALKRKFGIKMIFDLRGLMAEEYVDANHWPEGGLRYRVTKTAERRIFAATDAVVTLTDIIWPVIRDWSGLRGRNVHHAVVPCCVDLSLFRINDAERARRRAELGIDERLVLVYSGSLDGWYLTEEMADFFARVVQKRPDAHLLWLTNGTPKRVRKLMATRGVDESYYTIRSVAAAEVSSYLAAGDFGLSFIKRCFSKLASSPTKNGEYLACGLPLVINAGIGDSDALVREWQAGVLIDELNESGFDNAYAEMETLLDDRESRSKARAVAERLFALDVVGGQRYAKLYEQVLNG